MLVQSPSREFGLLCQAQLALLSETLGVERSAVYLTNRWTEVGIATLEPIAVYSAMANSDKQRLLGASGEREDSTGAQEHNIVQQYQVIIPLIYEEEMMGFLVSTPLKGPWKPEEIEHMEKVAHTIAIACVMDQKQNMRLSEKQRLDTFLHQLRNPLTALITFSRLLLKRLLPQDKNYEVAQGMLRESERIKGLIEHFYQAGEQEEQTTLLLPAGAQFLLPQGKSQSEFTLEEILTPVISSAKAIAKERGLKFKTILDSNLPPLPLNPIALTEAVTNLIDNALKYTPRGGQVQVTTFAKEDRQGIAVTDNGLGIPEEDKAHIFEKHYRGVQAQGSIAGTGLGLAIVKELVEAMGGQIELISPNPTFTSGTTFIIWLPASPPVPPHPPLLIGSH